ncbi:amino acid permease/ SLC12A domain-containing protein [Cladorrhinum samala]|uniref:Amino acid permease/ SLC12A domain-containing protein n=1 Tax=Cladorrhinum samala TaxID=585594 RepID=A0AAV9HZ42_9PEZI|nr:amino acid permease/ SLC12A domain-containing protein [Cladorrhinum samala]
MGATKEKAFSPSPADSTDAGFRIEKKGADNVVGDADSARQGELQRSLSVRHLNFIAIGGTVGTGFFLGSGTALERSGPAGALIAYVFIGTMLWSIMVSLAEMATFIPTAGAFSKYATRFLDPSLGFAVGWLYWFSWATTYALSLSASGIIIQYWNASISPGIFIAVFWVVFTLVNYLPVGIYGELEMWLSSLKVVTIVGFIIFAICMASGVGDEGVLGFKYWHNPGPFREYMVEGSIGKFVGFWAVLIQASVAYQGAELIGVAAGEARDPRKTVPKAIKTTFWGIMIVFCVSIFLLGMLVPSDDERLSSASGNASASPLVIAANRAGVKVLPDIINAVLLTAVLSAANANVYSGSRVMMAMAEEGLAPRILAKTNKQGIPIWAVAVTSLVGLLGFLNLSSGGTTAFNWLLNISGVAGLTTWGSTCASYIGFRRALIAQGMPRSDLPYAGAWQPFMAWYGLGFTVLIAFTQGFTAFIKWSVSDFFAAYISLILFAILWIGHKLKYRQGFVNPADADIVRGRYDSNDARDSTDEGV